MNSKDETMLHHEEEQCMELFDLTEAVTVHDDWADANSQFESDLHVTEKLEARVSGFEDMVPGEDRLNGPWEYYVLDGWKATMLATCGM
jgi:hypothetical protein